MSCSTNASTNKPPQYNTITRGQGYDSNQVSTAHHPPPNNFPSNNNIFANIGKEFDHNQNPAAPHPSNNQGTPGSSVPPPSNNHPNNNSFPTIMGQENQGAPGYPQNIINYGHMNIIHTTNYVNNYNAPGACAHNMGNTSEGQQGMVCFLLSF